VLPISLSQIILISGKCFVLFGEPWRNRTSNLLIKSYPLPFYFQ
jgi:hypothetical protein